jgi:predicted TIM-barrel fold metal-dependent hydrolase
MIGSTRVFDADSHLAEPPDLWTSGLPARWASVAPRQEVHSDGVAYWHIGDKSLHPVGLFNQGPWHEFPPAHPKRFDDVDHACYEAGARLGWMDTHGVDVQVLYPNVVAFEGFAILGLEDPQLQIACIEIYNDYVAEFARSANGRFVPMTSLPFWDLDASLREIERAHSLGHKGILWVAPLAKYGLPTFTDKHWDPVYHLAQELRLSINFHVGVGTTEKECEAVLERFDRPFDVAAVTRNSSQSFFANVGTISELLTSGLCDRFPNLNFVSVESGFGYIPFLLEALDWQWRNNGGPRRFPDRLLPSEYFRRQVYAMFWFEQSTLPLLPAFADNILFETDFPHGTSLTPAAGNVAVSAREIVAAATKIVGQDVMERVLWKNAATVYSV